MWRNQPETMFQRGFKPLKHKYNANGDLEIKIKIEAAHLPLLDELLSGMSRTVKSALRYIKRKEADNLKLSQKSEAKRLHLKKRQRLALSVFRKTKSYPMAAHASGLPLCEARMIIKDATQLQAVQHLAARNSHFRWLYDRGYSLRMVADRYGLHHSTVQDIIARERRNNPQPLNLNVLPLFQKKRRKSGPQNRR